MAEDLFDNYADDFDNFDAEDFADMFDGDDFDGDDFDGDDYNPNRRRSVKQANRRAQLFTPVTQVDIQIVNGIAAAQNVQLFNALRGVDKINDPAVTAFNPFTALDVAAANANNLVYWDRSGSLVFQDNAGAKCTISCKQVPYRTLYDGSIVSPFAVSKFRMSFTTDGQIDNALNYFSNSYMGRKQSDSITPRTFFNPNQYQGKIVDVKASMYIDGERGINYTMNASETVTMNMFIAFRKKLTAAKRLR